jgi:hypothetical protein
MMTIGIRPREIRASPKGWFKANLHARDTEAMFRALVADNERRRANGLPTFEPSYELAAKIMRQR